MTVEMRLRSTDKVTNLRAPDGFITAREWIGTTEDGDHCIAWIVRIGVTGAASAPSRDLEASAPPEIIP